MNRERFRSVIAVGILVALAAGMFADVLARNDSRLLSKERLDIASYFYWVRHWGFSQLRHGHLPLWNPHIMCGCPFFGNVQSALLYPPNAIFLFVNTIAAINWSIALHVLAAGIFTFIWCRARGLSHAAATLAGIIFMFCGACFYKILPGHLALVCAIAWLPLVLLAIDKLFATGRLRWSLLGSFAVAMQLLAGSAEYTYYTALVAGLYSILNLCADRKHLGRVIAGIAVIFVLGGMMAAWQAVMGMQSESMRAEGMDFEHASVAPVQPERLVALVAPMPIRDDILTFNVGVAGFVLAVIGAVLGDRRVRRFSAAMVVVLTVLALGRYTPLYRLLYGYFPKYGYFRVVGRFAAFASLFLAMLAGIGLDRLRDLGGRVRWAIVGSLAAAVILGGLGIGVRATLNRPGAGLAGVMVRPDNPEKPGRFNVEEVRAEHGPWLSMMLFAGAGLLVATAGLLAVAPVWRGAIYGIAVLAVGELFITAMANRYYMPTARDSVTRQRYPAENPSPRQALKGYPKMWRDALKGMHGRERVFTAGTKEGMIAMLFGSYFTSGYEAMVFERFRMLRETLREELGEKVNDIELLLEHPGIFQMLRVRYILASRPTRAVEMERPLGQIELVDRCAVVSGPEAALEAVFRGDFDPRKVVYLEAEPAVAPVPGGAEGSATIVRQSTDAMEIKAELSKPAILLVTDSYSSGWRARALGSALRSYEVMPANLTLRAIPLAAGKHHLMLEYRPNYYRRGMWISFISSAGWLIAVVCVAVMSYRRWRSASSPAIVAGSSDTAAPPA